MESTRAALPRAQQRLKECSESHFQCKSSLRKRIPTRLVSTAKNRVRLVEGDFQRCLEYATLSHCWGNIKFLMLKKRNHKALQNHIPWGKLSKTFKDAIEIARELGFAYIWIDSLCIVQDDAEDWKRESSLMSDVYGGSGINIAASGAVDGRVGCYFERPQNQICQVQVKLGNRVNSYGCVTARMYHRFLSSMPLLGRGWAIQERLLPLRTLHFTSTEVFWECHQKTACETFIEQFPTSLTYHDSFFKKEPLSRSMWCWIVERYSQCQLTYTKDKLVAISGVARIIQEQTRDQYVAGMWRKNLELQLCWYCLPGPYALRQDQMAFPYRGPTWSWASLDCRIIMWEIAYDEIKSTWIQVLDVHLQTLDYDPLGQLSRAQLRLSCFYLFDFDFKAPGGFGFGQIVIAGKSFRCQLTFDYLDGDKQYKIQKAKAMPVLSAEDVVRGLLLAPTGKEQGQYQRIGCFHFITLKCSESFDSFLAKQSHQVAEEDCFQIQKDKDGNTQGVITLV
jgi:hypothetical protein